MKSLDVLLDVWPKVKRRGADYMKKLTVSQWSKKSGPDRIWYAMETFKKHKASPVWYPGFEQYLCSVEFPPLLNAFMREVRRYRETHEHFGAKAIMEVLRYESSIKDGCDLFKINNSYTSSVANLVVLMFPELEEFFERRVRAA